jgi:polysaccharide export outer membrane protein
MCLRYSPITVLSLFVLLSSFCLAQSNSRQRLPDDYSRNTADAPSRERITNTESDKASQRNNRDPRELDDYDQKQRIRDNQSEIEKEEPPTEFQEFIYASTGQRIRAFGADLFKGVPTTFAPVDRVPVSSDYALGPGDELLIRAWGQIDIDYRATIDRSGNIFIPKVGNISLAGISYGQLQPSLKSAIGRVFHNFELTASMGQLRSIQVFVVGQAKRPGSYTVSSLSTLVNAVFASGGPSSKGSMRHIQLKRGGKVITDFDLYDLLLNGDKSKDVNLLPGDVIYIPAVGNLVAVLGSVNVPAVYEINGSANLSDLVNFAGGLTPTAAGAKVTVERITERSIRTMDEFTLDGTGLARELHAGDVVMIRPLSARFENAVTLRGNVATPGRYPWKSGARIRDMIPDREALITRDFWAKQSELAKDPTLKIRNTRTRTKNTSGNQEKAEPRRDDDRSEQEGMQTNERRNLDGNRVGDGDLETGNQDRSSGENRREKNHNDSIGEVRLQNDIRRNAPEINWDYAVVQRFNRKRLSTELLPFNLGKALQDAADENNLLLEPGDVITIFSVADLRTPEAKRSKFVYLEGEFNTAGVYEVLPGETLKQLISRVGDLTKDAYLYGSVFTRESTRKIQQIRLDEFVDRLEKDVERSASSKSQNVVSNEEAIGLKERADSQRKLVEKLRLVQANGRVVFGLKPSQSSVDSLPELVLEDGDRFFVPYRPPTINVVGAVYDDNSFIYQPSRTVSYYLSQAGGGTKQADVGHLFVVRADGSVVSKAHSSGWFTGSFNSLKLMPGDTVVLPEQLDKVSVLKGLKDWSQVISQFALGVAAIRSITRP